MHAAMAALAVAVQQLNQQAFMLAEVEHLDKETLVEADTLLLAIG